MNKLSSYINLIFHNQNILSNLFYVVYFKLKMRYMQVNRPINKEYKENVKIIYVPNSVSTHVISSTSADTTIAFNVYTYIYLSVYTCI